MVKRLYYVGSDKYDFPVEEIPIVEIVKPEFRIQAKNYKAVVRTDTNTVLGIVSKKYKLIEHKTVIERFSSFLGEPDFVRVLRDGAKMFAYFRINNRTIENSEVELGLLVSNGYDGKLGINIKLFGITFICDNLLLFGKLLGQLKIVHRGIHLLARLDKVIAKVKNAIDVGFNILHNMTQIKISRDELEDIIEFIKLSRSAKYRILYHLGGGEEFTLWDAFQGITWFITHRMKRKFDNKLTFLSRLEKAIINAYPEVYTGAIQPALTV